MTREEAIQEACSIVALAYHSVGDYSRPSDGFCSKCPAAQAEIGLGKWTFENSGHMLEYVRLAVVAALKRDGYSIAKGFDPETGKEGNRP